MQRQENLSQVLNAYLAHSGVAGFAVEIRRCRPSRQVQYVSKQTYTKEQSGKIVDNVCQSLVRDLGENCPLVYAMPSSRVQGEYRLIFRDIAPLIPLLFSRYMDFLNTYRRSFTREVEVFGMRGGRANKKIEYFKWVEQAKGSGNFTYYAPSSKRPGFFTLGDSMRQAVLPEENKAFQAYISQLKTESMRFLGVTLESKRAMDEYKLVSSAAKLAQLHHQFHYTLFVIQACLMKLDIPEDVCAIILNESLKGYGLHLLREKFSEFSNLYLEKEKRIEAKVNEEKFSSDLDESFSSSEEIYYSCSESWEESISQAGSSFSH